MAKEPYSAGDRRPIAAREHGLSRRIASALAGSGISANAISIFGMVSALVAGGLLAASAEPDEGFSRLCLMLAAILIFVRLLSNMFDGMVAVATGTASPVGELYNEVPDRISDTAVLVGAGYAAGGHAELGYLAALAALMTAYVRAVGKCAGAAQDFGGPMAKQQRMFTVIAVALYLAVVPEDLYPQLNVGGFDFDIVLFDMALVVIAVGSVLTSLLRLRRVARQLRGQA